MSDLEALTARNGYDDGLRSFFTSYPQFVAIIIGASESPFIPPFSRKSDKQLPRESNLPDPNVPVTSSPPKKILHKVLEHIPTTEGGRPTLIALLRWPLGGRDPAKCASLL